MEAPRPASIAENHSPDPSISNSEAQPKSYKCCFCERSFHRCEHLKRHIMQHVDGKRHRCVCGVAFTRSDVLFRHVKSCEIAQNQEIRGDSTEPTKKRTRVKRSCDRCAKQKSKCNNQKPCHQCNNKNLQCEYTRGASSNFNFPSNNLDFTEIMAGTGLDAGSDQHANLDQSNQIAAAFDNFYTSPTEVVDSQHRLRHLSPQEGDVSQLNPQFMLMGCSMNGNAGDSMDFAPLNFNLTELYSQFPGTGMDMSLNLDTDMIGQTLPNIDHNPDPISHTETNVRRPTGFSLNQLDPVEGKCNDIKTLLTGYGPLISNEVIQRYVTRQNLLDFLELYGKHYLRNYPVLHGPTFDLKNASTVLLLAMFCIGACYSEDSIPSKYVIRMAMCNLIKIQDEPHELSMETPPLSTIQASIAMCSLLACCIDDVSAKFVSLHSARVLSMATRAGVFDTTPPTDFSTMTEENFDWHTWIEQETKRRIACGVFIYDAAGCVFEGLLPNFSPLDMKVQLPCYEVCWEAETSSACFQQLCNFPVPHTVSTALRQLRAEKLPSSSSSTSSSAYGTAPILEISSFGMFILIKAIHCDIGHVTNYEMDGKPTTCPIPNITSQLQCDFSGSAVAALCDEVVSVRDSNTSTQINQALNNWHRSWELREYKDDLQNRCFALDPLPFWWLAKLFLLLYCAGGSIEQESEFARLSLRKSSRQEDKRSTHSRIVEWLARFRNKAFVDPEKNCRLQVLMQPIQEI